MSHTARFVVSDQYVQHVDSVIGTIQDPLIRSRYAGFLAVTAVTVFELAFKDIVFDFAEKKHIVFGNHLRASYDKLNGRISLSDIRNNHIARFGEKYKTRFDKRLAKKEKQSLTSGGGSIKSSYGNLVTWRNGFVHGGELPSTATFEEARRNYFLSKELFACLEDCLVR